MIVRKRVIQKLIATLLIFILTTTYLNLLGMVAITYAIDALSIDSDNAEIRTYTETIVEGVEADITAVRGLSGLQDGDEVYEGETIKYSITLKNNSGNDYENINVQATQTNGKVWDLVKIQLYDAMGEAVEPEDMYRLTDNNTINFEKIAILKNGESVKLEYNAVPDLLGDETTKTTFGSISIVSEDASLNKTIKTPENNIKKAQLKVEIKEANTRQAKWKDDGSISCNINITNLTVNLIENAELKVICSSNLAYDMYTENTSFLELFNWKDVISIKSVEKNEMGQSILTLQIAKIEPNETIQILDMPSVVNFNYENDLEYVNMLAYVSLSENNRYYSNIMERAVYNTKVNIKLSQKVYNDGKEIAENESIDSSKDVQFVITIQNEDDENIPIRINDSMPPLGVEITEVKLETDGVVKDITEDVNGSVLYTLAELLPKKTTIVRINTKINTGVMSSTAFENDVIVDINGKNQKYYSTFKFNTDKKIDPDTNTEQPGNEQPGNEQPGNEQPSNEQPSNEQPSNEQPSNNQQNNVQTNNGQSNISGNNTQSTTENDSNKNTSLEAKKVFDLKLEKYVSKITISNKQGTKTYEFDDEELAKAEIKSKYLQGTIAIIEYKIKVTNMGNVAGYAKQIIDYKPSDLKFTSSLNKDWYQSGSNLYTKALSKTKIQPGETKEIKLTLTKTLTNTNIGLTQNRAEIYEDYNDLGIKDYNSTPKNKNTEENDFGEADVIITISTGTEIKYIMTSLVILVLTSIMVYCIKNIIAEIRRKENV